MISYPRRWLSHPALVISGIYVLRVATTSPLPVYFSQNIMSLPPIKGKYKISTSAWRAPIAKRTFGEAKLKSSKFPAFQSEEISVQMFYPCDPQPPKKARFGEAWLEQ
jgi:hypothetical protein